MLRLSITYFLLLLSLLTFSQSAGTFRISGTVVSANTGEPISDGVIMISKTKGFKCDSLGNFAIIGLSTGNYKLSFSAFGYDTKDTTVHVSQRDIEDFTWRIYTDCWNYSREKALKDIKSKSPSVLLQGGIAPIVYKTDKAFEEKYKISFNDFGCVPGDKQECLIAYNKTVFDYLDKTYGKKWRQELRRDVIGLSKN